MGSISSEAGAAGKVGSLSLRRVTGFGTDLPLPRTEEVASREIVFPLNSDAELSAPPRVQKPRVSGPSAWGVPRKSNCEAKPLEQNPKLT